MKNIHVLPTNKPSRLHLGDNGNFVFGMVRTSIESRNDSFTNKHIYITSDEEFVRDEYITDGIEVIKANPKLVNAQGLVDRRDWKKIILTSDKDLIKDSVQAIDDEFLEWFVKNPSCESIKTESYKTIYHTWIYKIIIPKEEPKPFKQFEKLTEIEWSKFKKNPFPSKKEEPKQEPGKETADYIDRHIVEALVEVAKQKMYSEEDMKSSFQVGFNVGYNDEESPSYLTFEEWIREYKKK